MEEPPVSGKFSSRDLSNIHLASSQLYERCLSLKTGTERLLCSKTRTTCWYIHQRGRSQCPLRSVGYSPCSPTMTTPSTASSAPPSLTASPTVLWIGMFFALHTFWPSKLVSN